MSFAQLPELPSPDSVLNCDLIKSGKFLNMQAGNIPMAGYAIVFEQDVATELINDGQYILKSNIVFTSDCEYTSVVSEVTIPNYNLGVGTIIHTEIMATDTKNGLIKIKSSLGANSYFFVLKKIED